MSRFQFQDVLDSTGAVLVRGNARRKLGGVSTDTRTIRKEDLFLALRGPNFDGNRFATEALERGATGILLRKEDDIDVSELPDDVSVAVHASPRRALAELITHPRHGFAGELGQYARKEIDKVCA